MAKKRSGRRKPVRAKSRRSVKSTRIPKAGATGPVTLAQARALAKVRAHLERGAKLALQPASPATVGLERRKLEKQQELARRKRIKEYKATLAIMKRGVKGLAPRAVKGGRAPKAAAHPSGAVRFGAGAGARRLRRLDRASRQPEPADPPVLSRL
jgi:hypothetical protein